MDETLVVRLVAVLDAAGFDADTLVVGVALLLFVDAGFCVDAAGFWLAGDCRVVAPTPAAASCAPRHTTAAAAMLTRKPILFTQIPPNDEGY